MSAIQWPSLKFGTSGLRGLADELEGQAARRYVAAFLRHMGQQGNLAGGRVYLSRDFRPSSAAILSDCAAAINLLGLEAVDCGTIPTPALALHAMAAGCCAIMVTGSHIPADRNGLKFYSPDGEISKGDEAGILGNLDDAFIADSTRPMVDEAAAAERRYVERFSGIFPTDALKGMRIGVFQHSSVARDLLVTIIGNAGAEVVPLGRTDHFVAVDTEAFGDAVFAPLPGWVQSERLDALVSADGDADRPLLVDGSGGMIRGDVLGLLAALALGTEIVVTPVTSNSAIERTGYFKEVIRTKVGSPYVVAEMAARAGRGVVGFEASGGTMVGDGLQVGGQPLEALPTRDAVLPMLCALDLAARQGRALAEIVGGLPLQYAMADRLTDVPTEASSGFLTRLSTDPGYAAAFFAPHGISGLSQIDGLQFRTTSGDMVHFRASGNAPELRCYVEGSTPEVARDLLDWGMRAAAAALGR